MNWEAAGALGEILGAFAVLITLGYLSAQIRQNNQEIKISALRYLHDVNLLTENNERYIACIMKSQRDEALDPEERAHMVERFVTIMRSFENIWFQQSFGTLTAAQFEQRLDLLRWALSAREARTMWGHLAESFDPAFRQFVDANVLAKGAPTSTMVKAFAALEQKNAD